MNKHIWRVVGGLIRVVLICLPVVLFVFIVSYFDQFWNKTLWQKLWQRDFVVVGFLLSVVIFYLVELLAETRLLRWVDKLFGHLPVIGSLITVFSRVSYIIKHSKGASYVEYNSAFQIAFLCSVHKTKEGYLGTILYGNLPFPNEQLINEKTRIYALEIIREEAVYYEMIPTEVALNHLLFLGLATPAGTYKNAVEISFGEFVEKGSFLENNENNNFDGGNMTFKKNISYGLIGLAISALLYLAISYLWPIPVGTAEYYSYGWQGGVLWMLVVTGGLSVLWTLAHTANRLLGWGQEETKELKPEKDTVTRKRKRIFDD